MKSKFYYQKGYGGLEWILFAAGLGIAAYFFFFPKILPPAFAPSTYACYIDPLESNISFVDKEGDTYILIKAGAPTIRAQVDYHYAKQDDITLPPLNKTYPYYKVWFDDFSGSVKPAFNPNNSPGRGGGGFRPVEGADNLRFVDVSVDYPDTDKAYAIMDIYLREGRPVPQFILDYCENEFPIVPILRIQDTEGVSFPPIEINTGDASEWTPGPDTRYNGGLPLANWRYVLYAYDKKGSFSYDIGTGGAPVSTRQYTFTSDGKTVTYNAYFLINSSTETISLVNTNTNGEDADISYKYTRYELAPEIPNIPNLHKKSPWQTETLQLSGFVPFPIPPWGWWTPECKPAVYLYPEKDTMVNVKVAINNGFFTYTDPLYPKDSGWTVLAKPTGDLHYFSTLSDSKGNVNYPTGIFPYLYYEGKIQDSSITKPAQGFVKQYDQLSSFFDEILPKLGLNQRESQEFKAYWMKTLPKSPYYFIGVVPQNELNKLEPLTITPKEDTLIRVRLYFEALDAFKVVELPIITTPERNGFTVVDWGGMVKTDKNHPFTCVQ